MSQAHDAPELEGAARAAQFAAMSVTLLEAVARLRAQRATERADVNERVAAGERAQRIAEHANARVSWTPAHDDAWLRQATNGDLARAWVAAASWADTDVDAHEAAQRLERQLSEVQAMAAGHEARTDGAEGRKAIRGAAPPIDPQQATEATTSTERGRPTGPTSPSRGPRDVAADGYPYPTREAVAKAARSRAGAHVITTLPRSTRPSLSR